MVAVNKTRRKFPFRVLHQFFINLHLILRTDDFVMRLKILQGFLAVLVFREKFRRQNIAFAVNDHADIVGAPRCPDDLFASVFVIDDLKFNECAAKSDTARKTMSRQIGNFDIGN